MGGARPAAMADSPAKVAAPRAHRKSSPTNGTDKRARKPMKLGGAAAAAAAASLAAASQAFGAPRCCLTGLAGLGDTAKDTAPGLAGV